MIHSAGLSVQNYVITTTTTKKGKLLFNSKSYILLLFDCKHQICYTIPFHIIKNTILVELCTLTHGQLIYEPVLQNSIQHQPSK